MTSTGSYARSTQNARLSGKKGLFHYLTRRFPFVPRKTFLKEESPPPPQKKKIHSQNDAHNQVIFGFLHLLPTCFLDPNLKTQQRNKESRSTNLGTSERKTKKPTFLLNPRPGFSRCSRSRTRHQNPRHSTDRPETPTGRFSPA